MARTILVCMAPALLLVQSTRSWCEQRASNPQVQGSMPCLPTSALTGFIVKKGMSVRKTDRYNVCNAFAYISSRGFMRFCNVASLISLSAILISID